MTGMKAPGTGCTSDTSGWRRTICSKHKGPVPKKWPSRVQCWGPTHSTSAGSGARDRLARARVLEAGAGHVRREGGRTDVPAWLVRAQAVRPKGEDESALVLRLLLVHAYRAGHQLHPLRSETGAGRWRDATLGVPASAAQSKPALTWFSSTRSFSKTSSLLCITSAGSYKSHSSRNCLHDTTRAVSLAPSAIRPSPPGPPRHHLRITSVLPSASCPPPSAPSPTRGGTPCHPPAATCPRGRSPGPSSGGRRPGSATC